MRKPKNAGAALAALRKQRLHQCPVCEKWFFKLAKAKYCGESCRQRAKYLRGKADKD
jgi:hypothetical protein